jgi:predicted RNase H-like HicB family nuclease
MKGEIIHKKLNALVYKNNEGAYFVAVCPQLNLVATSNASPDEAFEELVVLCSEHIGFALESDYSWKDISTPLPPELEELLAKVQPNSTKTVTLKIEAAPDPDGDDLVEMDLDRVEMSQMANHL